MSPGLILLHQPLICLVPVGLRVGINKGWSYQDHLVKVRKVLNTSAFAMSCVTKYPFSYGSRPTLFHLLDLLIDLKKSLWPFLHIFRFGFRWGLDLPRKMCLYLKTAINFRRKNYAKHVSVYVSVYLCVLLYVYAYEPVYMYVGKF